MALGKHDTMVPPKRCGNKLCNAMPLGSMHRMPADLFPEKGWDALISGTEDTYRAESELDFEVVVQDAVFGGDRLRTETFNQFVWGC